MPTQSKAIVNKLLTNVSQQFMPMGYISEDILPLQKVKQWSGLVGRYGNEHLRIVTTTTGGKNKYQKIDVQTRLSDTYNIVRHGLGGDLTEEDFANVEKPFDAERDLTKQLTTQLWLEKEKGLADSLGNTSVLTQNITLSGTEQYNDYDNSDPIGDFNTAYNTILDSVCMAPNLVIMSKKVFRQLRFNPKILDALGFKDNRPGGVSENELINAILPGEPGARLLIGDACFNNADEGKPDNIQQVWGKHVIFAVVPRQPGLMQTTLGYRFQAFEPRRVFKNSIDNPPNGKEILVDDAYDQLLTTTNAAFLIEDAIA